jgi:uncharacterized protein YjbI with pentapeptide repeats
VDLDIGPICKRVVVTGNRYWKRGDMGGNLLGRIVGHDWEISEPEPFLEMDIGWKNAFGGPEFSDNPFGKGYLPSGQGPSLDHSSELPNVERPERMMSHPSSVAEPAGYGPLEITWPERAKKIGTKYGKKWEKERFPEPAVDMDPTYYNSAPDDQQLKSGYWNGDETIVITHMHPDHPEIKTALPAVRPRCFVLQKAKGNERWNEVPLIPETVWLFPNVKRGILVSRGVFEIDTFYGVDVDTVLLAWELRDGKTRTSADYRSSVKLRQDDETSSDWSAREDDLSPPEGIPEEENIFGDDEEEEEDLGLTKADEQAQKMIAKASDMLQKAGLNPAEYLAAAVPPPQAKPPKLEKMSDIGKIQEWADREIDKAEKVVAEMEAKSSFAGATTKEELKKLAEDKVREICKRSGQDYDAVMAAAAAIPVSEKSVLAKAKEMILKTKAEVSDNPVKLIELDAALKKVEAAELETAMEEDSDMNAMMRQTAHYGDPPDMPTPERAAFLRAWVLETYKMGKSLSAEDLTGVDLSNLNLKGADFKGATMDSANLSGCDLTGADMSECLSARVDFSNSILADVNFTKSGLGKAKFVKANLTRANLTEAAIDFSDFSAATLVDAVLKIELCQESDFTSADLSGVRMSEGEFLKSTFSKTNFRNAILKKISFMESRLLGADFSGADLEEACFVEVNADSAIFTSAMMKNTNAHLNCKFTNCRFTCINGEAINLGQTDLSGADFSDASLPNAAFGESALNRSIFDRVVAREADFTDSDLSDASFEGADLMQSSLQGTMLYRTRFVNAHLFGADLLNARIEDADFRGAVIQRTLLEES